jgi:2-amino-4-hydroxy-6-hydroxymethyldihydropteridine diphosphokinase
MSYACLGIGSNIGDADAHLTAATRLIASRIGDVVRESSRYVTEPLLNPAAPVHGQQPFLNMALCVETRLSPGALLRECLAIEADLGRTRRPGDVKWGPRIIDIDVLAIDRLVIDGVVIESDGLIVPHPEMHKRAFVLEPLREIYPEWRHPVLGLTVSEMADRLGGKNFA